MGLYKGVGLRGCDGDGDLSLHSPVSTSKPAAEEEQAGQYRTYFTTVTARNLSEAQARNS